MKTVGIILKILAALAIIAGVVFVVATYGDKIVAWTKKVIGSLMGRRRHTCVCSDDCDDCQCEADCNECPCVGNCAEDDVVAEADFEG